jgi:hypothetical protein
MSSRLPKDQPLESITPADAIEAAHQHLGLVPNDLWDDSFGGFPDGVAGDVHENLFVESPGDAYDGIPSNTAATFLKTRPAEGPNSLPARRGKPLDGWRYL